MPQNSSGSRVPPPRRRWLARVVLPGLICLLTVGLLAYAARDVLHAAQPVRVVRVVGTEAGPSDLGESAIGAVTARVQAPGWIEPDPYPTYITALTNGIIKRVLVLEGDVVTAGQVVAEMVDEDAHLTVKRAEAELASRTARLSAAKTNWQHPTALERTAAVSQARYAEANAERIQLDARIAQQEATLNELDAAYQRLRSLSPSATSQLEVEQAYFRLKAQRAAVTATQQLRSIIDAKIARFEAEAQAAKKDLRLRVSLRRDLEEAQGSVSEAEASLAEAKLRYERITVVSPVAGIVMQRLVVPGSKVMLGMDSPHSAHVAHVYDPNELQVRVDVPLADAAKVAVGQKAQVVIDVAPHQPFAGEVTRFVHQADISKNTVEVKVAIKDPSPLLKPDMLARVKFLGPPPMTKGGAALSTLGVYAPREAMWTESDQHYVWLVTVGDSILRRQLVTIGHGEKDGWVRILEGLQPSDVVVVEPSSELREGQRVAPVESEN